MATGKRKGKVKAELKLWNLKLGGIVMPQTKRGKPELGREQGWEGNLMNSFGN